MRYLNKNKFSMAVMDCKNIFVWYTTGRGDFYHSLMDDGRYVVRNILNGVKPSYNALRFVRDKVKSIGVHYHKNGSPFPRNKKPNNYGEI